MPTHLKRYEYPRHTYHFDSVAGNDAYTGQADKPLKSLSLISSMNLLPGDRVLLKGGSTFKGEWFSIPVNGTKRKNIYFGSYGTGHAIIDGTIQYTDWVLYSGAVYRRSHVSANTTQVFANGNRMIYAATEVGLPAGAFYYGGGYVYVRMSDDSNPNSGTVEYGNGTNGLAIKLNGKSHLVFDGIDFAKMNYGAINDDVAGSKFVTIKNCTSSFTCRAFLIGVTIAGVPTYPTDITIQNCVGYDDLDVPFWIGHGTRLYVLNSEAYNIGKDVSPQAKNYPTATHFPDGILISSEAIDCIVQGNYIHDCYEGQGIIDEVSLVPAPLTKTVSVLIEGNHIDTSTGDVPAISAAGANTTIRNNWINAGSGTAIMLANAPTNIYIYHNTIISPSGSGHSLDTTNQTMTACKVKNNIFIRAGSTNRYCNVAVNSAASYECDGNLYYGASTHRWFRSGTEYTALANWQAVIGGGDTGAIVDNAHFVTDYTNVHLQDISHARGIGVDLDIPNDYDQVPIINFDAGCLQY